MYVHVKFVFVFQGSSDGESDDESAEEEEQELEHEENCARCGGDEGLVFCSTCPAAYHLDCHEPPLRHPPRYVAIINWSIYFI